MLDIDLIVISDIDSKFNFMYESFLAQKRATQRKLPDIQQGVEVVEFMRKKLNDGHDIHTHFPLTDNCHAKAIVPPSQSVCLWLGANVMLEYPIDEAAELLNNSNKNAIESIKKLDENLIFLRDQITTMEVNIARLHNHMVKIKAQLRALEERTAAPAVVAGGN
jgi:prefoldin subunit 5